MSTFSCLCGQNLGKYEVTRSATDHFINCNSVKIKYKCISDCFNTQEISDYDTLKQNQFRLLLFLISAAAGIDEVFFDNEILKKLFQLTYNPDKNPLGDSYIRNDSPYNKPMPEANQKFQSFHFNQVPQYSNSDRNQSHADRENDSLSFVANQIMPNSYSMPRMSLPQFPRSNLNQKSEFSSKVGEEPLSADYTKHMGKFDYPDFPSDLPTDEKYHISLFKGNEIGKIPSLAQTGFGMQSSWINYNEGHANQVSTCCQCYRTLNESNFVLSSCQVCEVKCYCNICYGTKVLETYMQTRNIYNCCVQCKGDFGMIDDESIKVIFIYF